MTRSEIKIRSRELLKISIPMAIEHISVSLMGMFSIMLISFFVGEHATSAMGMVDAITHLILALFAALTTGGTIVVSQYMGRQDRSSAKRAGGQAIMLSVVASLVMFAVIAIFRDGILNLLFADAEAYVMDAARTFLTILNFSYPVVAVTLTVFGIIRGTGDTFAPMMISLIMNGFNLILGILLIGVFDLGVYGAAWSLTISKVVGLVCAGWFLVKRAKNLRINKFEYFKPDFGRQKAILRLGLPTSFESGLFQAGRLITQVMIVTISTAAIAANTIGFTMMNFANVPGMALATGAMILVGQRIGRGETQDVVKTSMFSVGMGFVFLMALGLLIILFRNPIFSAFNPTAETMEYLPTIVISYLLIAPFFWPASFVLPACLRATGDVIYPMVVSISTMFAVRIALGFVFGIVLGWGIAGVWMGMYLDWVARSAFFVPRMLRGKWKGKGIKDEK
ncbi:MAG: MATE family efflux transporter [Defluviitaleaceae bacterium]|nr:MATE family efflux transporter [Defluviitaleaceae bacterium]